MKVKTADLIGPALDWAVAQCESVEVEYINDGITRCLLRVSPFTGMYRPSVDWAQGGPIIDEMVEGEFLFMENDGNDNCHVAYSATVRSNFHGYGPTPLIAAMRCYVASKVGDMLEIPENLL